MAAKVQQKNGTAKRQSHFLSFKPASAVLATQLFELIEDPLPKALNILDLNNETEQRISHERLRQYLSEIIGCTGASTLQHYDQKTRNEVIRQLKDFGGSIRQISRLTGISFGIIRNA